MEPSRSAKAHHRQHRSRNTVITGILLIAGFAMTSQAAQATSGKPSPRIDALRQQADQLGTQLEQLTEQYDGLRVRLQQAQRATEIARATSRREATALKNIQQ